MAGIRRPRSKKRARLPERRPGLPFLSLLTEACAQARIPVPLPAHQRPVTGVHVPGSRAIPAESTEVRSGFELSSLASVVPHDESDEEMELPFHRRPAKLAPRSPRPRSRARPGGDPDGSSPRRRRVVGHSQKTPEELTEWDPSPPGAMVAQAHPPRRPAPASVDDELDLYLDEKVSLPGPQGEEGEDRCKRRAAGIFNRALNAYRRGELHDARTDAILARVYDPDNELYAYAERTWTAELMKVTALDGLICSSSSTTGRKAAPRSTSTSRHPLPGPSLVGSSSR